MLGAAERADGAGDGGVEVRSRAGDDPGGEGGGVELVFGVEDERAVKGADMRAGRRVLVQRWPAVPTAPNTAPVSTIFISAEGVMMMALLPPSSRMLRPKRPATDWPTIRPMRVLPVALKSGTRASFVMYSPTL